MFFLAWVVDKISGMFAPLDFENGMKVRTDLAQKQRPGSDRIVVGSYRVDNGKATIYPHRDSLSRTNCKR